MSAVAHANLPPTIRRWRQRFLNASNKVVTKQNAATEFPLSSYLSLHLLFSTYLLFSFILLPRSDSLIGDSQSSSYGTPVQKVSTDRPEHPFLTPITNDPLKTMTWTAIGVTVTVVWWGGHLRSWWKHELQKQKAAAVSAVDTDVGQGLAYRIESGLSEKLGVCPLHLLHFLLTALTIFSIGREDRTAHGSWRDTGRFRNFSGHGGAGRFVRAPET